MYDFTTKQSSKTGILIPNDMINKTENNITDDFRRPMGVDLIRILAAMLVAWFHIWQQSWLSAGKLEPLPRTGYVWVDMMILLSGFCLFLPYAIDHENGMEFQKPKGFYRRRMVRILPAYFACVAVHLLVTLFQNQWTQGLGLDLAAHLTLTHTWFLQSYYFTKLGGSLWTVGVLAGFYLLFPVLAKLMYCYPMRTFGAMLLGQVAFTAFAIRLNGSQYQMVFNRLPAFIGVLGLGMVLALLYIKIAILCKKRFGRVFLLLSVAVFGGIFALLKYSLLQSEDGQRWQLLYRMPLAVLFGLLLLCFCLGFGTAQKTGVIAFLSAISYSFYLWHQSIAVWLKQAHIPFWQGDVPPNQLWDKDWMLQYHFLCWGAAFVAATLSFLVVEKLFVRLFVQKTKPNLQKNQQKSNKY